MFILPVFILPGNMREQGTCGNKQQGNAALVEVSPGAWKEKARFKLEPQTTRRKPQGKIWAHPVVVDGRLYLRDQEIIHCYDVKGK